MQDLNKNYRGKDTTTDVLSFHYFEDFSGISHTDIAGECIFSQSKILSQAVEYGHTPKEEFEILLIHSVLHILGFDHEDDTDFEDMWRYEENIRTKI
jgi:probable rRNA maturation factor